MNTSVIHGVIESAALLKFKSVQNSIIIGIYKNYLTKHMYFRRCDENKTLDDVGCHDGVTDYPERMQEITDRAIKGLGTWVQINEHLLSKVDEAKGPIVCPWPHAGNFAKRITILKNEVSGLSICWSDLSIHMIREHGFFERIGSMFRVEPEMLVEMIF